MREIESKRNREEGSRWTKTEMGVRERKEGQKRKGRGESEYD
ncbi:Uncharacterised protein r2_g1277 [Pycnogonum litorale]